jgi:hypothetical protein
MITEVKCKCGIITPFEKVSHQTTLISREGIEYYSFRCDCGQEYLFKKEEPIIYGT